MKLLLTVFVVLTHGNDVPPAWSADGHRIACEIAWRHLTPEARSMVQQLRQGETGSFAESCTWADDVRDQRPETSAYHFVNIPAGTSGVSLQRDCGDARARCVVWAIKNYAGILANPGGSPLQRQEALKFLSHFVGDLHQPLHAGRLADLGGNRLYVSFFGDAGQERNRMQLHRVWDTSILRRAGLTFPGAVDGLADEISPVEVSAWVTSDVLAWTNESYKIDEEFVYSVSSGAQIGDAYYNRAVPIVRQRLKQAGIRLAHVLNEAARGRTSFAF